MTYQLEKRFNAIMELLEVGVEDAPKETHTVHACFY